MNKIEGVPNGWRLVRIGAASAHEYVIDNNGNPDRFRHSESLCKNYCVIERIEPAQPKYRPFANDEEFKRHRYRWVRVKANGLVTQPSSYTHDRVYVSAGGWLNWRESFEYLQFDDGTPFGVEVIEA